MTATYPFYKCKEAVLQRRPNCAIVIEVQADSGVAGQDSAKANSAVGPRNDLYIGLYYFEKTL